MHFFLSSSLLNIPIFYLVDFPLKLGPGSSISMGSVGRQVWIVEYRLYNYNSVQAYRVIVGNLLCTVVFITYRYLRYSVVLLI